MCGLAGIVRVGGAPTESLRREAECMGAALLHRGPDDDGLWVDPSAGVALAFRRLSIIDLSPLGHQPMRSASGRYTLVYNGEVFNFSELRTRLEGEGTRFRGRSDTEVILAAFESWGIRAAVERFVGMFALAVWDAETRTLTLARDRLGIKPLYLACRPGLVLFGSELKALATHPQFDRSLDRASVVDYLRYLYVPGPATIYAGVRKVPPGCLVAIPANTGEPRDPERYWDLSAVARRGLTQPFEGTDAEATEALETRLREAVAIRMVADVPLGAFLSGGIDSSLVVALMQTQSMRPVRTYSIAFSDPDYDEAGHAARVAKHLGTEHCQIDVSGADALALVPRMVEVYDEPLADTAQLPLFLMCGLARRHVTVALSGDGGDEVFAGYNRYARGDALIRRVSQLPEPVRAGLARLAARLARPSSDPIHRTAAWLGGRALRERAPGERLAKLARVFREERDEERYRALLSVWDDPPALAPGRAGGADRVVATFRQCSDLALLERMQLVDQLTYLPEDQLAKVDRASMANSLEVRVPLLDHRVVEFAWTLPRDYRIRDGQSKWLLRRVLARYVPMTLVDRPKMGFSVPIDRWLRGPLRAWATDLLRPDALRRDDLLVAEPIETAWRDLLDGRGDAALGLWAVVMLQAWRQRWT